MRSPAPITLITLIGSLALSGCKTSKADEGPAAANEVPATSEPALASNAAPPPAKPAQAVRVAAPAKEEASEEPAGSEADEPEPAEDDEPSDGARTSAKADKRPAARRDARDADDDKDSEVNLAAKLGVKRLVIATGVSGREPVGIARSFAKAAGQRIFAFVEVTNPDRAASAIYVSFFKEGGRAGRGTRIDIGRGARWRTWVGTRRASSAGTWHAVVYDGRHRQLASTSFEITAPAEPAKQAGEPAAAEQAAQAETPGEQGKPAEGAVPPKAAEDKSKAAEDKSKAAQGKPKTAKNKQDKSKAAKNKQDKPKAAKNKQDKPKAAPDKSKAAKNKQQKPKAAQGKLGAREPEPPRVAQDA